LVQLAPLRCYVWRYLGLTPHQQPISPFIEQSPHRWILHCGDAYTYHGEVDPQDPHPPPYQRTLRHFINLNRAMRPIGIHSPRLRALLRTHGDQVQLTCSHDPQEFEKFQP